MREEGKLVLGNSLQSFFYDQLKRFNDRSVNPLPNESIFYSSLVMDKFGESQNYFEVTEEGVRDKILGINLLESSSLPAEGQKRKLKDIGDTALFICGYFSESVSRKLVNVDYYHSIGVTAYKKLDYLVPEAYDINNFYKDISESFLEIINLMSIVAQSFNDDEWDLPMIIGRSKKKLA